MAAAERFADHLERNADAVVMLARIPGLERRSAPMPSRSSRTSTLVRWTSSSPITAATTPVWDPYSSCLLPRLALIGVGADNGYGHPTAATLTTLAEHGVCTLRTDLDGTSGVFVGPEGMRAWRARATWMQRLGALLRDGS